MVGNGSQYRVGYHRPSPREREMIGLVKQALSNREIARRMGLTYATVKTMLSNIYAKVGVSNRTALALWDGSGLYWGSEGKQQ